MYSATDTMGLKTKVHISVATIVDVVLVQHIIKALVQVLQVEQDLLMKSNGVARRISPSKTKNTCSVKEKKKKVLIIQAGRPQYVYSFSKYSRLNKAPL